MEVGKARGTDVVGNVGLVIRAPMVVCALAFEAMVKRVGLLVWDQSV